MKPITGRGCDRPAPAGPNGDRPISRLSARRTRGRPSGPDGATNNITNSKLLQRHRDQSNQRPAEITPPPRRGSVVVGGPWIETSRLKTRFVGRRRDG